jgi:hypothetical protein
MGFENQSRPLAYHPFLSARDTRPLVMARAAEAGGRPAQMRAPSSTFPRAAPAAAASQQWLFWFLGRARRRRGWACMASGQFGQFVLVLPAIDTASSIAADDEPPWRAIPARLSSSCRATA